MLSRKNPNSDAIKILCKNISAKCDSLESHWQQALANESFPKRADINRHLRFAESHDFEDLISNDFIEADNKALNFVSENLSNRKGDLYVSKERIDELSSLSSKFDLTRLVYICKELNLGYQTGQVYALPLLVRCILDHIPPIFECKSFKEVANNYPSGTKSFRESVKHLEESSRKIGDSFLHTQIRQSESLPNSVQVDFRQSLDVVLSEIVRILR
ncbi:hypothetical protein [Methylovulum psychrotolerans]|nr:hypothetical protein [Methylovulum psychrotolerans]